MQITEATTFGRPQAESGGVRALVAGASAGLLGGIAWYLIVRFSGYEVGWVAWGVGLVVGKAMAASTSARSRRLAVQAGVVAAAALIVGKLLIFQWAAGPALANELQKDPETLRQLAFLDLYESGEFPADLAAQIEALDQDEPWPDSLAARIDAVVNARIESFGEDDLDRAAAQMAGVLRAEVSLMDGLLASFTPFDLLWFFLAVGTAWGLMLPERQGTSVEA